MICEFEFEFAFSAIRTHARCVTGTSITWRGEERGEGRGEGRGRRQKRQFSFLSLLCNFRIECRSSGEEECGQGKVHGIFLIAQNPRRTLAFEIYSSARFTLDHVVDLRRCTDRTEPNGQPVHIYVRNGRFFPGGRERSLRKTRARCDRAVSNCPKTAHPLLRPLASVLPSNVLAAHGNRSPRPFHGINFK